MSYIFVLILLFSLIGIPIGLIKPALFQKLFNKTATRKSVVATLLTTAFVSMVGIGITAPKPNTIDITPVNTGTQSKEVKNTSNSEQTTVAPTLSKENVASSKTNQTITENTNSEPTTMTKGVTEAATEATSSEATTQINTLTETTEEVQTTTPQYNCSSDTYNCGSFSTKAAAQAAYDYCISQGKGDIHDLDRDHDGSACESLL